MSIFSMPGTQLTTVDLRELVEQHAVENLRLEFKREIPNKDETLKKLSAFANTYGGLVIVGAEANSKDGRIVGMPGVDPRPGYRQTVVQWCFEGVAPPLEVWVSDPIPSPENSNRVCYVISVSESDFGPHFINGRRGVYVRSDEFSSRFDAQLATESELRHLFNRREIVVQRRGELLKRARERFETFARKKYSELGRGKKDGIGARFGLAVGPRFPARALCDHASLLALIPSVKIPWRQVGFPRTTGGGFVSQHESLLCLRPGSSFSILEATTWGMLYYASEVELDEPNYRGIHVYHFLGQLLVFLCHAGTTLKRLGFVGSLQVDVKLEGFRDVPWIYVEYNSPITGPRSELDDTAEFSLEVTAEDLVVRRDAVAVQIVRNVFMAMNWPDAANNESAVEDWIRRGYEYNTWGRPTELLI